MRSDSAPPIGSQMKFDTPTHSVTSRLSAVLRCSTVLPKVGAYTVIR
ncbi:hypothetical protein AWB74_08837 [Caballeronia arvi]|uniref:Uncharacterized protein n=1 Tax=Caballeronia arvi TaxID=1777135 RepID=A0A158L7B8_9BURK|nr:hypothetical protein AWB74_08837 [Caballeronia arvi]